MIVGIGHDLIELARIGALVQGDSADKFLERVLTTGERAFMASRFGPGISRRGIEFVAGRFAAKEAIVKALGCGIGEKVGFGDITVLPDESGKPVCELSGKAWTQLGLPPESTRIHVTITHTGEWASAVAVAERLT